ncbi:unnamed protein product, partial [Discosporangium mesarthrocarpum]
MKSFLEDDLVPRFNYKASRDKIEKQLSRPLAAVSADLMGVATSILDAIVRRWGHIHKFVEENRGDPIERAEAEHYIEEYLEYHKFPGKLQVRWVDHMNGSGIFQECGPRAEPTKRHLRLWINRNFEGVAFSRSIKSFTDHEICTHAMRAINDHNQVWAKDRKKFCLHSLGSRKSAATEEGLASLNALMSYPDQHQYLWSAALLYYCAVRGQEMGFAELHKHLAKYVKSPSVRYWHCIRAKGKRKDLSQPGACGKGQVYLEGAVEILHNIDNIDFHLLFSGRVPLGKLGRIKNLVRPSLVTLPRFVKDQDSYKAILRRVGELNGI